MGEATSKFDGETIRREFRIDWIASNGTTISRDALEVADTTVAEWRFFNDHRLDENGCRPDQLRLLWAVDRGGES